MKKASGLCLVLTIIFQTLWAQHVTHGPVIGAVSAGGARIYVRTAQPEPFTLQLSTSESFSSPIEKTDSTRFNRDNTAIVAVQGLQPFTYYYIRFLFNGQPDSLTGRFRTFPITGEHGHYVWTTGACQEFQANAFDALGAQNSDLFIHTGDFTYPDYQIGADFRTDWSKMQLAYRKRYEVPVEKDVLRRLPIDYVEDNHDGPGNAAGGTIQWTHSEEDSTGAVSNFITYEQVTQEKFDNCMKGYDQFFPHYPLADSLTGHYHSYRYGNAEIFFLDVRNCGTQIDSLFHYNAADNLWEMNPTPGHTMLGKKQMDWLKNGLKNSTADWKFIASGVMFNKAFRKVINVALALQTLKMDVGGSSGTGFKLAHAFSYNWAGFVKEQDDLLNFLKTNNIKDVAVLSGHVHTNVMDNGLNAGLPELNSGPLASTGAELTYYLDSIMQLLGFGHVIDSLWNGGGQGVNNKDFKNGFGRIDIYGQDSMALSIIDEDTFTVSRMRLIHSSKQIEAVDELPQTAPTCVVEAVYPNPAKHSVNLRFCPAFRPSATDKCYLIDFLGRMHPVKFNKGEITTISIDGFAAGEYLLMYDYGQDIFTRRVSIAK